MTEWKYIAAVFMPNGDFHPIWREPFGKQRISDPYSCTGYLTVMKAVEKRRWVDRSTVASYSWSCELGLWVLSTESGCYDPGGTMSCVPPDTLPASVGVLDPGGPSWKTYYK